MTYDKIKAKASKVLLGLGGVCAAAFPTLAGATGFGSGMVIPTGTTGNVTDAITDYFFPTVLKTLFQAQVIEIVVVLAAVFIMWRILRMVIGRIKHPGR